MDFRDFDFCGFNTLSRFFRLDTRADAEALDAFFGCAGVSESFEVAGPGTYYVLVDKGWDRVGDYSSLIIKRVPDAPRRVDDTLAHLACLKEKAETAREPFALLDEMRRTKTYAQCTADELAIMAKMDTDALFAAEAAVTNFMIGFDE